MARNQTSFVCQQCGYEARKWLGKCPNCNAWASFVEFTEKQNPKRGTSKKAAKTPQYLKDIPRERTDRIETGISELDLVLGGGLVYGQVVLLAGEPGIGKSTLVLELANKITPSLYSSGEESVSQIKIRADRMGMKADKTAFLEETNIDVILATLEEVIKTAKLKLFIIDSVQTMYTEYLTGVPGSVGQVKEVAFRAIEFAKRNNIPVIIIGHVTKEGTVAGPSTLAHMVDTVLWFEGDKVSPLRVLRSVKNRFASTDEVGIFQMKQQGLVSADISEALFLDKNHPKNVVGSVISCMMEGTRPILVEVQSLVVPSKLAFPRRVVHGIDSKKAELIIAILTRYSGINLMERDVFVNIVGGIKVNDPGVDLAVAMAIASSFKNKPVNGGYVIGEVGLLGEVREPSYMDKRITRLSKQGFKKGITPKEFSLVSQALKQAIS